MSSDNFNYIAKSGRVYLNLSASAWEGLDEPLTEQDLIDAGAKHTGWATMEDAYEEPAEFGPLAEDPLSIILESAGMSLKKDPIDVKFDPPVDAVAFAAALLEVSAECPPDTPATEEMIEEAARRAMRGDTDA